jgi:hypothetical protein
MSYVRELDLIMAQARIRCLEGIRKYVAIVLRDEPESTCIDLSESKVNVVWEELNDQESALVHHIRADGITVMYPSGWDAGSMSVLFDNMDGPELYTVLIAAEEYMIEKEHMHKPDWIPAMECKDGHVYLVKARNFSYGRFNKSDLSFHGVRHKFGDRFIDSEEHYDTGHGSAQPLKDYGPMETCSNDGLKKQLDELREQHYKADEELLIR